MSHLPIAWIAPGSPPLFPPAAQALVEPDGLLALGGDLSRARLLAAYGGGIFPWYGNNEPILWWSPDPRCVFDTASLRAGRSLRRQMRDTRWTVSIDHAFDAVIHACAAPRPGQGGTWITDDMVDAYVDLHHAGNAHSIEVWDADRLVGGLYGVAVGRIFCGESMFSAVSGGSKSALTCLGRLLHRWHMPWLDAQVGNPHLYRMGAQDMPRVDYLARLRTLGRQSPSSDAFQLSGAPTVADLLHS